VQAHANATIVRSRRLRFIWPFRLRECFDILVVNSHARARMRYPIGGLHDDMARLRLRYRAMNVRVSSRAKRTATLSPLTISTIPSP
jgi:hypothetical protein